MKNKEKQKMTRKQALQTRIEKLLKLEEKLNPKPKQLEAFAWSPFPLQYEITICDKARKKTRFTEIEANDIAFLLNQYLKHTTIKR